MTRRKSPIGGAQRADQRAGVEDQAELVLGRHRRQDDPTAGPAFHVQARRFDSRRGSGQSRDLRVAAKCGGCAHRKSRKRSEDGGELSWANAAIWQAGGGATTRSSAWRHRPHRGACIRYEEALVRFGIPFLQGDVAQRAVPAELFAELLRQAAILWLWHTLGASD